MKIIKKYYRLYNKIFRNKEAPSDRITVRVQLRYIDMDFIHECISEESIFNCVLVSKSNISTYCILT